jgi:hypothetical protein
MVDCIPRYAQKTTSAAELEQAFALQIEANNRVCPLADIAAHFLLLFSIRLISIAKNA